jgi:tetratricopeptide (TPR) repeat protein
MTGQQWAWVRGGLFAALLVGLASPVAAQSGALSGKVVDSSSRPVDRAEVILDFVGDLKRQYKTVTDKNGEWVRVGVPVAPGTWKITAQKDGPKEKLIGSVEGIAIKAGETTKVKDIIVLTAEERASGKRFASADEAAVANKTANEIGTLANEANALAAAGKLDEAAAKLTELDAKVEKCAQCLVMLGEIHMKRKDYPAAEAALQKALTYDENSIDTYRMLAALYNDLKRFDEASKAGARAAELMEKTGATDATTLFNLGVGLWNTGKGAEAQPYFEKTIKADPKNAEAHYLLALTLLNQGKMQEAKAPLTEYLKLAPTGPNAAAAKGILANIK